MPLDDASEETSIRLGLNADPDEREDIEAAGDSQQWPNPPGDAERDSYLAHFLPPFDVSRD